MKTSAVIILLITGIAATIAVIRHQDLRDLQELTAKKNAHKTGLQNERASNRRPGFGEVESTLPFTDFLAQAHEIPGNDRDLTLLLGTLPDFNQSGLTHLIKTLAKTSDPNPKLRQRIIFTTFALLSSRNPETALTLVLELRESQNLPRHKLDFAADTAVRKLAIQDPLAAAQWFTTHTDGTDHKRTRQAILSTAAKLNPSLALELISELKFDLTNRNDKYAAYHAIGSAMSLESVDQVLASRKDLDPSDLSTILRSIGSGEFKKDFDTSTDWFDHGKLTPGEKGMILTGLSYPAIKAEPEKWLDWVSSKAGTDAQSPYLPGTMGQTIYDWAGADYLAAGKWLQRQEDSPIKTDGVARYIDVIHGAEPKIAAEWLETLPSDHEDRQRLSSFIHRSLVHQDPEAAAAFAEKHQLSE